MKVTVCFDNIRVVVPCGDGTLLVRDLMHEAILRYRKATGKNDKGPTINSLSSLTEGGILDPDDRLCDVADDREQIVANYTDANHAGGDGASSVGTNSPDFYHQESKDNRRYASDVKNRMTTTSNIKRESVKRFSMHALSTREPHLTAYSALSLPRESRRREPLGQDAKAAFEFSIPRLGSEQKKLPEIHEIVIKNEAGPLGLHVVPCYDLLGNDQGLRVEGIEPNGRISKDGQIDLHDKIIAINGNNLLHIPFSKVQEIFRTCMNDNCLKISVLKHKKPQNDDKNISATDDKVSNDIDDIKKLQSNYNLLRNANTRKIGRMIDIELTKGNNGLGFSVTTRDNPAGGHCPIYIKNILQKGAAVEDGRLRPGDRLHEVNGTEMTGKSQSEVVTLLRNISSGGKVRLIVSRQEEIGSNTSCENTNPETNPEEKSPDNTSLWSNSQQNLTIKPNFINPVDNKIDKDKKIDNDIVLSPRKNRIILTLDIPVHDTEKAGLGVSVKGKTTNTDDNTNMDLGIFIKSVLHGGAASRDKRLRTNDQLLNVNGVSLLGLSNSDAMETLRRAMINTNSSITGVITLTIARRVTTYDNNEKIMFHDNNPTTSSYKLDANKSSIYGSEKKSDGRVIEKNDINAKTDNVLTSNATPLSPWNPVIDRLTEQYNKNSLRNESYCLATNKTWIDSVGQKLMLQRDDNIDNILIEESTINDDTKNLDDAIYSGDPTYDSQLSLEEIHSSENKFSRDALGRQSMSEKRHAALDAKNTDTYKRNKKLREGRDNKVGDFGASTSGGVERTDHEDAIKRSIKSNESDKNLQSNSFESSSSFEFNRKRSEKKIHQHEESEYVYNIPGNNKFLSPRKHWLVDDDHTDITDNVPTDNHNKKDERPDGFTNTRGDVKQASLNSALDERYKRSRKKGGIRSMLRLGKNRKSLNFGDNIENRHETSNYCSGTINYIA